MIGAKDKGFFKKKSKQTVFSEQFSKKPKSSQTIDELEFE